MRAKFRNTVLSRAGRGIRADISVRQPGASTLVADPLYDSSGGVLANPLTANVEGEFEFYMDEPQRVDLFISASGRTSETVQVDVVVPHWEDAGQQFGVGIDPVDNLRTLSVKSAEPGVDPLTLYKDKGLTPNDEQGFIAFVNADANVQYAVMHVTSDRFRWSGGNGIKLAFVTNSQDQLFQVGINGAIIAIQVDGPTGQVKLGNKLYPGTDAAAQQTAAGIYAGSGVPSDANGADGDFYFNGAGGAMTTIFQRRSGAWVGIV